MWAPCGGRLAVLGLLVLGACGAVPAVASAAVTCTSIQTALDTVADGGTVTVDQGTYSNCSLTLPSRSITLLGSGTGAIFDGGAAGDRILTGTDVKQTTLRNLTFKNSTAPAGRDGGAVFIDGDSAPTVDHVQFSNNVAGGRGAGGGLAIDVFSTTGSPAVTVSNSTFQSNKAGSRGGGAAITDENYQAVMTPMVTGNLFTKNSLTGLKAKSAFPDGVVGAGLELLEGGNGQPTATQVGNVFDGNSIAAPASSDLRGGGEHVGGFTLNSRNDRFTNNSLAAPPTDQGAEGAGLAIEGQATICSIPSRPASQGQNLVAAGNTIDATAGTGAHGAGIYVGCFELGPATLKLFDSTVSGNQTGGSGATAGIFGGPLDQLALTNSIVKANSGGSDLSGFVSSTAEFSDVCTSGGAPFSGSGNICTDPLLVAPGPGSADVHQVAASPTIDKGSNSLVPAGLTQDYEGNARITDGGSGHATVDMGAHEFVPASPKPTPGPAPSLPPPVFAPARKPKPQCVVPRLKHKTLGQTKTLLARKHCKLGKTNVSKAAKRRGRLRVTKSSPAAGTVLPNGARVAVRLGSPAAPAAKRKPSFTG
ncbi:MAG: hypothetical protein NVSMB25_16990 [Thermoleophilaceae bacterium]